MFKNLKNLNRKVNILEGNVRKIFRDMKDADEEAAAVGGITDATIDTGFQSSTPGPSRPKIITREMATGSSNFIGPSAYSAANDMFGTNIPGSFDKDMGN